MKINKHITIDSNLEKLLVDNKKNKGTTQIEVIETGIKAYFEHRILPTGTEVIELDVTNWIIAHIPLAKENDNKLSYRIKNDIIEFELYSNQFDIFIDFNLIEGYYTFKKFSFDSVIYNLIDFDDSRLNEIYRAVWKLLKVK